MSLAELWQLFPISLSVHQKEWKEWAAAEIDLLAEMLAAYSPDINHIGSTAIPDICAKPIIDILVEIPSANSFQEIKMCLADAGYICMSESDTRVSFNKGYTTTGYADKVFHIHIHICGDRDEIYFRDWLIAHPSDAKQYEQLKLSLLPRFRNDRDGYTDAKAPFINDIIRRIYDQNHSTNHQ